MAEPPHGDTGRDHEVGMSAGLVPGGPGTTRVGFYLRRSTFEAAKSAYLADLDLVDGAPDSLARWVSAALGAHARLGVDERAAVVQALPIEAEGGGFTRSFEVADQVIAAMNAAIVADRRAGRAVSRSGFAGEAIRIAIEAARQRAGGVLHPAPARLPNRPVT